MNGDQDTIELTRRDAVVALSASVLAGSAVTADQLTGRADVKVTDEEQRKLVSLAEVLYPSAVEPTSSFVETYVVGRYELSDEHINGLVEALETVEKTSKSETGVSFEALDRRSRDAVLRETGAQRARPDPDGTVAQKVRYYVVNELLYALYRTPVGGELVGNPNPAGFPGGVDTYQKQFDGE